MINIKKNKYKNKITYNINLDNFSSFNLFKHFVCKLNFNHLTIL